MSAEDRALAHAIEMKAVTERLDDCITKRAHFDLKELMETRFDALDRFIDERHAAQQLAIKDASTAVNQATAKAELATERRFESVNEFRRQLADQTSTFIPRVEAEARIGVIGDKLDAEIARSTAARTDLEQRLQAQLNTLTNQAAAAQGSTVGRETLIQRGQFTTTTALGALGVIVAVLAIAADILVRILVK